MRTDTQLEQLKVPGTYDCFSNMRRVYDIAKYLDWDVKQCIDASRTIHTLVPLYFRRDRKKLRTIILFVLRWCARGLTLTEACRKYVVQYHPDYCFNSKVPYKQRYSRKNRKSKPKWSH